LTANNVDSYKIRRAKQLGLPLINVEYVHEYRCLPPGQTSIDIDKFIIKSVEDQENFTKTGTISVTGIRSIIVFLKLCRTYNCSLGSRTNATKINKFDLNKIKLWNSDDADLPRFDELTHCEIGKWAIFKVQLYLLFSYTSTVCKRKPTTIQVYFLFSNFKSFPNNITIEQPVIID
jgi:hypothetical protein